jgi:hypothetical protein
MPFGQVGNVLCIAVVVACALAALWFWLEDK